MHGTHSTISSLGKLGAASVLIGCLSGLASSPTGAEDLTSNILYFTDYAGGSTKDWLRKKGFKFKRDANKRDRLDIDVDDHGLVLEAKAPALGLLMNESVDVATFSDIEIDWGVLRYPDGASYENAVNNEAVMIYVFMGDERFSSGSFLIPDSPYFIGLYLCRDDRVNHPYVGRYFKKGGRYVCVGQPEPGQQITSKFDLLSAYRAYFDKEGDDDPAISGIAIAVDTTKSGDGGKSLAFIARIQVLH